MSSSGPGQRLSARDPSGLLLAVVASTGIGMLGANTLPLLLGSVMDQLAIGESRGGLMGTVELGALALVCLLVAPRVGRLRRSVLAFLGGGLVIVGCAVSAAAGSYSLILAGRLISGAGAGAVMAAGSAAVAVSSDPDGLMARVMLMGGAAAAMLLGGLPWALEPWGYRGGFAVLGCVTLLCLPFLRKLPLAPGDGSTSARGPLGRRWLGVSLLLAIMVDAISADGLWAFSERIGVGVGLTVEEVGIVLGFTTLSGIAGAGLAYVLGRYTGRAAPIVLGLGLGAAARWLLANASEPTIYWAAQLLLGLAFFLTYPFLLGAIASLDPKGRWAAAGVGTATIGTALAPAIAGLVVEWVGYPALGILGVAAAASTAALTLPVVRILAHQPTSHEVIA